jgi:hypothetical protein
MSDRLGATFVDAAHVRREPALGGVVVEHFVVLEILQLIRRRRKR